ncbi:MAG: tetratricopeptide repeat protein [Clostridiales bacterium]|nr:tetratricopeptide repeat protein [Clostridiales bacterium]
MNTKSVFMILIFFSFLSALTSQSYAQRDFGMEERRLIERFKRADNSFQKGKEFFIKEKYDRSEKELRQCLEIMPEHANALLLTSQIYYKRNDFNRALTDIEKAKKNYAFIAQFYTFIHTERLEMLRDDKMKLESEIASLQDALSRATSEEDRQKSQSALGALRSQISVINSRLNEPLPDVLRTPAEYFYIHGNVLFKLQRYQEAHDQYLEAIKADSKHANAYNNLINLYYIAKNYELAIKFVNQAEANGAKINPKLKEAVLRAAGK